MRAGQPASSPLSSGQARAVVLAVIATVGLVAFLGIRPHAPWILWLTAALAALATDGIVRSHPRWESREPQATAVYIFLPALAVLGAGFFMDHAIDGYARTFVAFVPGVAVGIIAFAEYHTVNIASPRYGTLRLALAVATYLTAFVLYTVIFTNGLPLWAGVTAAGLVSTVLAMDLLRESRLTGLSSLYAGLAVGVSIAEFRLALYFFPLDGLLAGALLIIGFYLATGLVHHLLDHDLELSTAAEYLVVAGVGTAAVIVTRVVV